MYPWQTDAVRFSNLVRTFQADTARANVFQAARAQSSLMVFTGADAVSYFQNHFGYDLQQAMAFGVSLMSAQVFLSVDGKYETFDRSDRE